MKSIVLIAKDAKSIQLRVAEPYLSYINLKLQNGSSAFYTSAESVVFIEIVDETDNANLEKWRKNGAKILIKACDETCDIIEIENVNADETAALALAEGIVLRNYRFNKYIKEPKKQTVSSITYKGVGEKAFENTLKVSKAVHLTRDLVNEPVNHLNATEMANSFVALGKEYGFSVEVWNEAKIESQKMGALLAVNKGSQEPPTFSIMEYKPTNAINTEPYVLVGKGVVFDTGGLSLKPTPMSMDYMKCDMGGAAVVAGTLCSIADLKLPVWVVGLVPATDNRPGENAICPGDIITSYNGTTIEVLNTDAEGRLILCDALAYAKKYKPKAVFDFATLTGAAARAIGEYGTVIMGNANNTIKDALKESGEFVFERLVEFPIWPEYFEETKGTISDLKNLGKSEGGAQSAGAFLQYFTDYPWMHFDIAPSAYIHADKDYRTAGGTGVCVRLLTNYFTNLSNGK